MENKTKTDQTNVKNQIKTIEEAQTQSLQKLDDMKLNFQKYESDKILKKDGKKS